MKLATLTGSNRYHSWARTLPGRTGSIWWWTLFSLITVSWIVTTPTHLSAAQKYYYIHIGSFRAKENAVKVARDLQQKGYPSVVSGERVPNKGYWYRIYVGPISSLQQAKLQSSELKKGANQVHGDLQEISYPGRLGKNGKDCKESSAGSHGYRRHKAQPAF